MIVLLRLTWTAYDGTYLRLRQQKTSKQVQIRVLPELKAMLDAKARTSTQILTNKRGLPWTPDGFKSSWATACAKAAISGVTFHDLRGTAVRWMAEVGCSEAEMASITGHSLSGAKTMLDHYWSPSKAQADEAIRKLAQFKAGTNL
jgi:integrase